MRKRVPLDNPLHKARLKAGLSIEELAVHSGISRTTVYLAERAPSLMTERTAEALAKLLEMDPKELRP